MRGTVRFSFVLAIGSSLLVVPDVGAQVVPLSSEAEKAIEKAKKSREETRASLEKLEASLKANREAFPPQKPLLETQQHGNDNKFSLEEKAPQKLLPASEIKAYDPNLKENEQPERNYDKELVRNASAILNPDDYQRIEDRSSYDGTVKAPSEFKNYGNCSKVPENIFNLYVGWGIQQIGQGKNSELVVQQLAKMIGMGRKESDYNTSNITLHSNTAAGHLENTRRNFRKKAGPTGQPWYLASSEDLFSGFSKFQNSINKTTNFGIMQISPDQFVRQGSGRLLASFIENNLPSDPQLAAQEVAKRCGSDATYGDYENMTGHIQDLLGRRSLVLNANYKVRLGKNVKDLGAWLALCPNLNLGMANLILDNAGYQNQSDSGKLRYFGTRADPPVCADQILTALQNAATAKPLVAAGGQ